MMQFINFDLPDRFVRIRNGMDLEFIAVTLTGGWGVSKGGRQPSLDSDADPVKRRGREPRGRAREKVPHYLARYRTTRSRVPPTVVPSNRGRPNVPRAHPYESRPPALSQHGPGSPYPPSVVPSEPSKATVATTGQPAYVGGGLCFNARVTASRLVAPFRRAVSRDRADADIKGRLPPRCRGGLPDTPSWYGERDSSNNRDTGNTGERRKRSWKFRSPATG